MARKRKKEKAAPLLVSIAPGTKEPAPGTEKLEPPPAVFLQRAAEWAVECGLKKEFTLTGPERIDYPKHGHGYSVTVQEREGFQRMATARFTAAGQRNLWTMDSRTI